ncbi:MAG TPA: UbiA family prenyltransferase [Puia sp.]
MTIYRSTIQLLRFHFSFFLMPVYWFALSQLPDPDPGAAMLIFFILHGLLYPSSNGYNSYMDRDEGSIGGLQSPPAPTRQLYRVTLLMDLLALALSLCISGWFMLGSFLYILASRAYSARQIRLKRYPVTGYLTVIIFQGALVFFMVSHGADPALPLRIPVAGMVAAALLVGGAYPLTQIYQHEADARDGVRTLSALLGYRGTFIFSALLYGLALGTLAILFLLGLELKEFMVFATLMVPVIVYFTVWAVQVWRDPAKADFHHSMRMNGIASICTNLGFIIVFLMHRYHYH